MAKEIILYNLREDVKEQDYVKWCEDYKGPLLIGLPGSKSFTLLKMMGGAQGNGQKVIPPSPAKPPFNYIGILDATSPEEWGKSRESKAFKEFFSQWSGKWAADFYILGGIELYHGESAQGRS
ncbi:MAG: hypothetical protein OEU97_03890 [Dehalococcoidia bacterium]|nr:hypothetical protein [Dehalococcoidia bacterium]MDH4299515.1 hypothetical protein [Dehalococcoidia bacterium]MDH4366843.1 hypothetical protein [Dehalococcoidia bacterium]